MKGEGPAAYGLAGALLAAAPLAAFLGANAYPLASPEVALLAAACVALGALASVAAALGTTLAALALGLAAGLCIDFAYGGELPKPALLILPLTCLALAVLLRRHIALVIAASAFAFLLSSLAIPTTSAGDALPGARASGTPPQAEAPPLLLHLILDEHIGLEGLPRELPETAELARWLAEGYVAAGFRIHSGAYSEYFDTRNSIANLLNLSSHEQRWAHLVEGRAKPYVLAESAYFRHLAAQRYALRVYQSDHIDLCRARDVRYAKCVHYRANSIASLQATSLDTLERLQFIVNSFLETSDYLQRLRAMYANLRSSMPQLSLPAWGAGVSRVGPLAVLPVVEQLERDLRRASHGEAYVAHLLIPHYPYVFDESCRLREKIEHWLYNVPAQARAEAGGNSAESRAQRYRQYAEQIRCQQALLGRLFAALKEAGVWESAIVIVHGDHGSRIFRHPPNARNAALLSREDFNDSFSTLFAMRKPGVPAGVATGARPLQELLAEALTVPMAPLEPKVYLRSAEDRPLSRRAIEEFR